MDTIKVNDSELKIRESIRNYISDAASMDVKTFKDDILIFENSLLDSMGFLFLIEFLTEKFNVEVKDTELVFDNFKSVDSIVAFVQKQLQEAN